MLLIIAAPGILCYYGKEVFMGRCDYELGHNGSSTPEGEEKMLHQARRILIYSTIHAKRLGIPPFALEGLKLSYQTAKATFEELGPEPPPEPDPIDGYTVYWDKKQRFEELLCDFHGIPVDKNGSFNRKELALKMLNADRSEWRRQWQEYLMSYVQENAARYNMPPEWAENVRRGMEETLRRQTDPDRNGKAGNNDGIQQYLLAMFYEFHCK